MAHSLQAKKRIRQTARRTDVNQEAAMKAFREMQPTLMSGVNKGLMEKNTVSRKLSRLSKRIKGMAA